MALILLLLIPILVLYWFSNHTSLRVVTSEVEKSMYKDLTYFAAQTDNEAGQLSKSGLMISEDINVRAMEFIEIASLYEQTNEKLRADEKMRLMIASSAWDTTLSIYAPGTDTYISSNNFIPYSSDLIKQNFSRTWHYTKEVPAYFHDQPRFVRYITDPFDAGLDKAALIVEMSFPAADLSKALDRFKNGGKGDPFFITEDGTVLSSMTADRELQSELIQKLQPGQTTEPFTRITLSGREYAASCVRMPELGLYLVDYLPIQDVIRPITTNSYLFYGCIFFLLVGSTIAAYFLYKTVQVPIRELIRGVRRLRKGEYPTIKVYGPGNEFYYLMVSFNEMAKQIEELIQNVYLEEIRSRDANLKQLQSQINPHFLYNCFTLIRSLTRLGEKETVMQLTMHLSKYYRYTTRSERPMAELSEELDLVGSYLAIQAIKVQDLNYDIHIPEEFSSFELPRLILQPLVENAVLHGIEPAGSGTIKISSGTDGDCYFITVADDGVGMSDEKLAQLEHEITLPPTGDKGCALWNTRQRMMLQFGPEAGLKIRKGPEGGMETTLYWPTSTNEIQHAS